MWNIITTFSPELIPIIIGVVYITSLIILRTVSLSKIILSLLILLSLTPINITAYAYVFSAIYITQALIFMGRREQFIAYKHFMLAFLATAICLNPILPYYKIAFLIIALMQVFLASEKIKAKNPYLYISNLALLAGLVLKIQPVSDQNLTSLIIMVTLLATCFKILLSTSTVLTIFPIFVLVTVFSERIILVSIFMYVVYLAILINSQKYNLVLLILLLLPFVDLSIFNISFLDVLGKNTFLNHRYVSLAVAILLSMCVAKALEVELKKKKGPFSYKTILLSLFPSLLIAIKATAAETNLISLPIPLFAAIPLIIIEAKYLSLLSKLRLKLKFRIPKIFDYCFRWLNIAPKTIHIKKLKFFAKSITDYTDTRIQEQDYTTLLATVTLIIAAIIFLYMEVL